MSETGFIKKFREVSGSLFFKRVVLGLLILITFIIIYGLNVLYPIYIDDWDYSYIYWHPERVNGIIDAIYSQSIHYVKWGGRSVLHALLQLFLGWGPFWSDLLNSIAFVAFIGIIYLMANVGNRTRPSIYFMIVMLTWFFQADFGESVLWLTGSLNYLWGSLIIFSFIFPYYRYFNNVMINKPKVEDRDTKLRAVFFFFLGIIAGWTNENMVVAMMCMLIIFLFCVWKKERRLEKWTITGFIGGCIGAAFMMLAPGNYIRYKILIEEQGWTKDQLGVDYYMGRLEALLNGYVEYVLILLVVYIVVGMLFWFTTEKKHKKQILFSSLIFFSGSIIASLAMVASPIFNPRTWFGIISLTILAMSILYANLNFSKLYIQIAKWCCIILMLFMFVKTYTEGREELAHIRSILDYRESEIEKQKSEGKTRIVFGGERFEIRENRRLDVIIPKIYDFPVDTTDWMYKAYERYHGVDAVRFENERPINRNKK